MPRGPLFSTYRQGENRVTSSMLAVFQRIDLSLVERLLANVRGESTLAMVTFRNQVVGDASVPDAEIAANFRYFFEVKTARNAIHGDEVRQLRGHLSLIKDGQSDERLFVVTPDATQPALIDEIADPNLTWFSFAMLSQAIDDLLDDRLELVSEQARFLLRELQALFADDGLIGGRDVVVVAARNAYGEYLKYAAYVCQPDRSFADAERMGFYASGSIQPQVPIMLFKAPQVTFNIEEAHRWLKDERPLGRAVGEVIQRQLDDGARPVDQVLEVVLLSPADDAATVILSGPIPNSKVGQQGQTVAWTMYQRYVRLDDLRTSPVNTTALDALTGSA